MPWPRFLIGNVTGAIAWAGAVGGGAYLLGQRMRAWSWPASLALLGLAAAALAVGAVLLKRREAELQAEADKALPDASAGGRA